MAVECAFGMPKSRFRILLDRNGDTILHVNRAIITCCVLHNICIDNGDEWENTMDENLESNNLQVIDTIDGEETRDKIKDYMNIIVA